MMIQVARYLLFPISVLYGAVVFFRNKLYDWGIFKAHIFKLPIICIGNLAVGGAGKTPATEYLVRLLDGYKVAILSRGYGRKTRGFILADGTATADQIGDEPLQYFHKFKQVTVAVCEDRVFGIQQLESDHDVILLDDAFQHRAVKAGFNLLLFEFQKILKPQFLMPTGYLRETMSGYKRADAVLITKCPVQINYFDRVAIHKKIDLPFGKRLSFASIRYGALMPVNHTQPVPDANIAFLLTGIANPEPLFRHLKESYSTVVKHEYPDHHQFTAADLEALIQDYASCESKEKIIITTEKDSKRLIGDNFRDLLLNLPIFYLPIEMEPASKDKHTFDQNILDYVASAKRIG